MIDVVLIGLIVLVVLLVLSVIWQGAAPLGLWGTRAAAVVFVALAAIVAAAVAGRFGGRLRTAARAAVVLGLIGVVAVLWRRWPPTTKSRYTEAAFTDSAVSALPTDERLRWAVRVATHAISVGGLDDSVLHVPPSWSFPGDASISVRPSADSTVVESSGDGRVCHLTMYLRLPRPAVIPGRHDPVHCSDAAAAGSPLRVIRGDLPRRADAAGIPAAVTGPVWNQYRRDASRTGVISTGGIGSAAWRAPLDGEVRASPSVAGDYLFIGTHGPGSLYAFDAKTGALRWARYLPNWVHQDVVSDGRIAVIGFGDNTASLMGDAPSGVSAFAVATGDLLWTAFEGNSVMTSAMIWNDNAVYITSAGVMSLRSLATGVEVARRTVPGRATMAPPVLTGDVVVAALDSSQVCAIQLPRLEQKWCTRVPEAGMLGHAAPTVIGDRVYFSGGTFNRQRKLGMTFSQEYKVRSMLGWKPPAGFEYLGQRVWAIDLATGRIVWESKLYPAEHGPQGHVSGTLVEEGGVGVILLPVAGKMVALDLATGTERWVQEVGPTRGPPAHTGGKLYLTLRSGEFRVVDARSGTIECSAKTGVAFDRAGPVIADSTLFHATQPGLVAALPLAAWRDCAADRMTGSVR